MRTIARHWASAVSVLLHGAFLLALIFPFEQTPAGATSAGLGGIEISLGPSGAAAGSPDPVQATQPPEEVVKETPVETAQAVEPDPIEIEAVEAPVPNIPPPPRKPKKVEPTPTPPAVVAAVEPKREEPKKTAEPAAPGAAGRAGISEGKQAGAAESTSGGGLPGSAADYMSLLRAWLEKHKEYPREARARRQQGTALLYFSIDRNGKLLAHRLQRTSGIDSLDREVMALVQRADPMPPFPADFAQAKLELVVPVQFQLR